MKKIWFLIAALIIYTAIHTSASAAVYTESFAISESGSTKADSLNENGILIRNNRNVSDKNKRGSNLREAYIKIDISGYAGKYPVEQARLRLYLKTLPSNNGTSSENETPTCDVYAFASFNTGWDQGTITYANAQSSGVRPAVDELEENPAAYAQNPEQGYLDMQSFSGTSSTSAAYYFDITPFVNDMLLRGQTVGTVVLMQAGGSISRESTVMQFFCEDTAGGDSALIPAVVITPGVSAALTDRNVRDYSSGKAPYATVSVHNNTQEQTRVTLLGIISGADGRVYDAACMSEDVPANGRNSASLRLVFQRELPEDINGFGLSIYAFDDMEKMSLLNRSYKYGSTGTAAAVYDSEPLNKEPSVAEINVTQVNSEDGTVSISGALDTGRAGTNVAVRAYLDSDVNQALAECVTDSDGKFETTLYMPEFSGSYSIVAGGLNISECGVLENVSFFSHSDVAAVMEMVNAAADASELESVLQGQSEDGVKNIDVLGVDYAPAIDILKRTDDLSGFYTYLLDKKADGFGNNGDFLAAFKEAADIYTIADAKECTPELAEIIEGYVGGTGIYHNLYSGTELDEALKSKIISSLLGRTYGSIDEICSAFDENAVLIAVSGVLYTDVEKVLRIGKDVLGFDIDKEKAYWDLTSAKRANVTKKFDSYEFGGAEDVYKKLTEWINEQKKTGTAATGGGGSKAGSSPVVVKITPQEAAATVPKPLDSNNIAEFKDLNGFEWAQPAINALYKNEIVAAGDGYFRPGDAVTRAEFVKMLVCAFDMADENAQCSFEDTDSGKWHYIYIASAYNSGIVSGMSDTHFGAQQLITRQEMAAIAYRLLKMRNVSMSIADCSFDDAKSISDWAITPVYALKNAGIISGVSESEFAPLKNALRAEAAVIISGLLSYTQK